MSLVDTFSPTDRFVIGVDPGQQVDPTAIAVVQVGRRQRPLFRCGHLRFAIYLRIRGSTRSG
jgi:hypothetical protein